MAKKKLTAKTLAKVAERVLAMGKPERDNVLAAWNDALDAIGMDDGFGTEWQLDPRGDGRS